MSRRFLATLAMLMGLLGTLVVTNPASAADRAPQPSASQSHSGYDLAKTLALCPESKNAKALAGVQVDAGTMVELNPCVDIDLSQVIDCRSGVCYKFCWDLITPWTYKWCEAQQKDIRHRKWITYRQGSTVPSRCRGGAVSPA
ncbi:hypothetical protein [Micromonospora sp. DT31]|uniref:hypothetical protein n=1 Tax=Micromonospora sp. DT31 TaxID=3393434 RepID=UPI003CECDF1F